MNLTDETQLTFAPKGSEIPSIAKDHKNNVHLVWQDNRKGTSSYYEWEIYYKRTE